MLKSAPGRGARLALSMLAPGLAFGLAPSLAWAEDAGTERSAAPKAPPATTTPTTAVLPLNAPNSVLPSTMAFQPLPYDETYTHYADPTLRTTTWARLKHIPLWENGFLTIGGDARLRTETREHMNFGKGVEDHGLDIQHRLRLWGDLHLTDQLRAFAELQATGTHGTQVPPNAVDSDGAELHQAFLEVDLPVAGQARGFFVRTGRQEIALGRNRLFDTRNAPNTRRSFDALRTQVTLGDWRLGAMGGWTVTEKNGDFNDGTAWQSSFMAGHVARRLDRWLPHAELELLYIRSDRLSAPAAIFAARRDTLSARLAGQGRLLDYDIELVGQRGRTRAGQRIGAWFLGVDAAHTLPGAWKPRLGLRLDLGSGGPQSASHTSTYDFLWTRGETFTAEFGYSNLVQLGPSFGLKPSSRLTMEVTGSTLRRYSVQDGLYSLGNSLLRAATAGSARYVGFRSTLRADYQWNRYLLTGFYVNRISAGTFLRQSGSDRPLLYTSAYLSTRF